MSDRTTDLDLDREADAEADRRASHNNDTTTDRAYLRAMSDFLDGWVRRSAGCLIAIGIAIAVYTMLQSIGVPSPAAFGVALAMFGVGLGLAFTPGDNPDALDAEDLEHNGDHDPDRGHE